MPPSTLSPKSTHRPHRKSIPPPHDKDVAIRRPLAGTQDKIPSSDAKVVEPITNGKPTVRDLIQPSQKIQEKVPARDALSLAERHLPVGMTSKIITTHASTVEGSSDRETRVLKLNIDCEALSSNPEDCRKALDLLLQNDLPLSTSISVGNNNAKSAKLTPAAVSTLEGLIAASPRWTDLQLRCSSAHAFAMFNRVKDSVPNLEQIDLHTRFHKSERVAPMHGFSNAHKLRHMRVDSVSPSFDMKLSLGRLETYTEHGCHFIPGAKRTPVVAPFRELMPKMSNVTTLEIPELGLQPYDKQYDLPCLQFLVCKHVRVLQHLNAPSLIRAEILDTPDLRPLLDFCRRTGSKPQVLLLHNVTKDALRTLPADLRKIRSLSELYIQILANSYDFPGALTADSSVPMLPKLTTFTWVLKMNKADAANAAAVKYAGSSVVLQRRGAVPCTMRILYTWGEDDNKLLPELHKTMKKNRIKGFAVIPDHNPPLSLTRPRKHARAAYTPERPMILKP